MNTVRLTILELRSAVALSKRFGTPLCDDICMLEWADQLERHLKGEDEWRCEQHPQEDWPHGTCPGPGIRKMDVPKNVLARERRDLAALMAEMKRFLVLTGPVTSVADGTDLSRDGVRVRVKQWLSTLDTIVERGHHWVVLVLWGLARMSRQP